MLVNITETYVNGRYTKGAASLVNGKEVIIGLISLSGPAFTERLAQFENGFSRSIVVDVPVNLGQKGSIRLTLPKA